MKLRLKRVDKIEEHGTSICAVTKCQQPTDVIIGTKKERDIYYGLCWKHWEDYCRE